VDFILCLALRFRSLKSDDSMAALYEQVHLLSHDEVFGGYGNSFFFECGEAAMNKLTQKVAASTDVSQYIERLALHNMKPDRDGILLNIGAIGTMALDTAEKYCMAAFIHMEFYRHYCDYNYVPVDLEHFKSTLIKIADKCSKMKLKKNETVFRLYFNEMRSYVQSRLASKPLSASDVMRKIGLVNSKRVSRLTDNPSFFGEAIVKEVTNEIADVYGGWCRNVRLFTYEYMRIGKSSHGVVDINTYPNIRAGDIVNLFTIECTCLSGFPDIQLAIEPNDDARDEEVTYARNQVPTTQCND